MRRPLFQTPTAVVGQDLRVPVRALFPSAPSPPIREAPLIRRPLLLSDRETLLGVRGYLPTALWGRAAQTPRRRASGGPQGQKVRSLPHHRLSEKRGEFAWCLRL